MRISENRNAIRQIVIGEENGNLEKSRNPQELQRKLARTFYLETSSINLI